VTQRAADNGAGDSGNARLVTVVKLMAKDGAK